MDLAILGTDADLLQLVLAAIRQGHGLVWLGDVRAAEAEAIQKVAPGLSDRGTEWELLLDHAIADAVIVGLGGADSESRADQLKRLAAEGVPILAVHPAADTVITFYELDMIRRETGGVLHHYNPVADHPLLAEMAAWIQGHNSPIGSIHQLTCERRVGDTQRSVVLDYLARDMELIANVAGDIRRVTAIGPAADDVSFASLQVQMISDHLPSLRWSPGSPSEPGSWVTVSLIGERGRVTLRAPDSDPQSAPSWKLETELAGQSVEEREAEPYDSAATAIDHLAAAIAERGTEDHSRASTWEKATRAMEVVDAALLSLEKGRTVDVFQQQLTPRLAFRGAMAALGCGLLLIVFAAVVVVAMLGGAEGAAGQRLIPSWPLVLLGVLAFFLLLQAVPLLASKAGRQRDN